MSKVLRVVGVASVVSIAGLLPTTLTFAATRTATPVADSRATANSEATVLVAQGPGYTVYEAPANAPKPKAPPQMAQGPKSPNSGSNGSGTYNTLTNETGNYNSTQSWNTDSTRSYNGSYVETESKLTLSDAHKSWPWQPDYLTANGVVYGYWWGSSPFDANNITLQPSENVTATSTVTSVSIPAGVSVSSSSNTMYLTWPAVANPNTWDASYSWGKWEVQSSGTISNAQANDIATFTFGSNSFGVVNTINVNY